MKIESTQNKSTSIDETEQSFSLRKLILLPLLIIATIICGYFALPTTKTIAGSPIGWNEWSSQGQSFQDATTLGIVLNAGRAGLGGGTLGMSEIVISTYNYIQDGDADAFQQHVGGVAGANLIGAGISKISGVNPKFYFKKEIPPSTGAYIYENGRWQREVIFDGTRNTGRPLPVSIKEQMILEHVKSNPSVGTPIKTVWMTDQRWLWQLGWQKMRVNMDGVEIHYVRNRITGRVADFKIK